MNPIQPCSQRSRQETTLETTLLPPQRRQGALRFGLASASQWHSRKQAISSCVLCEHEASVERASRPNVLFVLVWNTRKNSACLICYNTRSNFWRGGSGMTGRIKRKSCTSLSHASKQEKNFCKNIYINDWWKHVTLLSSLEKAHDVSIFCTPYSLIESYHLFDRVKVLSKA